MDLVYKISQINRFYLNLNGLLKKSIQFFFCTLGNLYICGHLHLTKINNER